jgi:molybdopterin molybdotransferase
VPQGADAVVMVEHCTRADDGRVATDRVLPSGTHIARQGCEAEAGAIVLARGTRIDYPEVSWLATTGHSEVKVYARPRVAIIATGDEIVEIADTPAAHQIRNSNAWSLAAQVQRAGGVPVILPVARDTQQETRMQIELALEADLFLLSGGVSAGKYDVVEPALAELGAEFFFDRVLIQPGQPLVFGRVKGKYFFGLPGNPASTMVTFELFARAAIQLLAGCAAAPLPMMLARLTQPFHHRAGLTRFLPANISCADVTPVPWQGSGDVPALCRANAFLVADAEKSEYEAGDMIPVMLR